MTRFMKQIFFNMITNNKIPRIMVLKTILIVSVLISQNDFGLSQSLPAGNMYIDQEPPGDKPRIFALSVKPGFFAAERIAVSNDGKNIYYSEIKAYYPVRGAVIKKYTFAGGKWTGPDVLFEGMAPALSVTGDTMYLERMDDESNYRTYISVRNEKGWNKPESILSALDNAHYLHSTRNGNYYISSKAVNGAGLTDWCRLKIRDADTTVISLGRPLNTPGDNLDFFIARDESFIITTSNLGLCISYLQKDGSWSNPVNLGPEINFGLGMWGPFVTQDNKYLFYSTGTKPDYSDVNIYWVRFDDVIKRYRQTMSDSVNLE